jgi:hypothetical protein
MQYQSPTNDCLDQIEHCLAETEQTLQLQTATLRRLQGNLADTIRREDLYAVQFSEMLRLLVRDLRELRAVLIWSVVSEGFVSTDMLQTMLWAMSEDMRRRPPALQSLDDI